MNAQMIIHLSFIDESAVIGYVFFSAYSACQQLRVLPSLRNMHINCGRTLPATVPYGVMANAIASFSFAEYANVRLLTPS